MIGIILLLCVNQIYALRCGQTSYGGSYGTINQYSYQNSTGGRCTFSIKATRNSWLRLSWQRFKVNGKMPNCYRDSVAIKVGCRVPRKVAEFCSNNMDTNPHDIYSPDECMVIVYSSEGAVGGFVASYKSFSMRDKPVMTATCSSFGSTYLRRLPRVIRSPNWPSMASYRSSGKCKWKIKLSDKGKKIVLNIMNMRGYSQPSSSTYCSTSRYTNALVIKGKKSVTRAGKQSWRFCDARRQTEPYVQSIFTDYHEMEIEMSYRTSSPYANGFIIGVVAYEDELAKQISSWTSIVGGIAVALIAVVVVLCCYRRHRRRRMLEQQQPMMQTAITVQQPPQTYVPSAYPDQAPPPYAPPPAGAPYAPPPYQGGPQMYPSYPPPDGGPPQAYPVMYPPPGGAPPPQGYAAPYPTAYKVPPNDAF